MHPDKQAVHTPEKYKHPFPRYRLDSRLLEGSHLELAERLLRSCHKKGLDEGDLLFGGFAGLGVAKRGFGDRKIFYAVDSMLLRDSTRQHDNPDRGGTLTDPFTYASRDGGEIPAVGVFRKKDVIALMDHPDLVVDDNKGPFGEYRIGNTPIENPENCYVLRPGLESLDLATEVVYFFMPEKVMAKKLGNTALSQ